MKNLKLQKKPFILMPLSILASVCITLLLSCGDSTPSARYTRIYPDPVPASEDAAPALACEERFYLSWLHVDPSVSAYKIGFSPDEETADVPVAFWEGEAGAQERVGLCFDNGVIPATGQVCFRVWARNDAGISAPSEVQCVDTVAL